jgi:hypothetical protein
LLKNKRRQVKPALKGVEGGLVYFFADWFPFTLISLIRAFTFAATFFGNGAYCRAAVMAAIAKVIALKPTPFWDHLGCGGIP